MTELNQSPNDEVLRKAPWTTPATSDDQTPPPEGDVHDRPAGEEEPHASPWGTVGPMTDPAGESEEVLKD
jgi:hypothetical protein